MLIFQIYFVNDLKIPRTSWNEKPCGTQNTFTPDKMLAAGNSEWICRRKIRISTLIHWFAGCICKTPAMLVIQNCASCIGIVWVVPPATVDTRIVIFLVGDPYKPSFATVTGRGDNPRHSHSWNWSLKKTHPCDMPNLELTFPWRYHANQPSDTKKPEVPLFPISCSCLRGLFFRQWEEFEGW